MQRLLFAAVLLTTMSWSFDNVISKTHPTDPAKLTVMISKANNIFYYHNELEPDASNFKISRPRDMENVIYAFKEWNKDSSSFIFLLKVQDQKTLNENSRKVIQLVQQQKGYSQAKLSATEAQLIALTEKAMN